MIGNIPIMKLERLRGSMIRTKWKEAYQCKGCEKIFRNRRSDYCIDCGVPTFEKRVPLLGVGRVPAPRFATENIKPVIVRRNMFKLEVMPSRFPAGLIQGKPPPWD